MKLLKLTAIAVAVTFTVPAHAHIDGTRWNYECRSGMVDGKISDYSYEDLYVHSDWEDNMFLFMEMPEDTSFWSPSGKLRSMIDGFNYIAKDFGEPIRVPREDYKPEAAVEYTVCLGEWHQKWNQIEKDLMYQWKQINNQIRFEMYGHYAGLKAFANMGVSHANTNEMTENKIKFSSLVKEYNKVTERAAQYASDEDIMKSFDLLVEINSIYYPLADQMLEAKEWMEENYTPNPINKIGAAKIKAQQWLREIKGK